MKKSEIVRRLLFPAHEEAAKAIHPTMTALHHPSARSLTGLTGEILGLRTARPNMSRETELLQASSHLIIVVALVQAQALRLVVCRFWPPDHEALESGPHPFHIVAVRPIDHQADRNALSLCQQTALDAALAPVGGVRSCLFPPQGGLWPSPHPYSTMTNRCRATHRNVRRRLARALETRQPPPARKNDHGPWIWRTTESGSGPPTGSPCAARRKWHPRTGDRVSAGVRHRNDGCSRAPAMTAPAPATALRRCKSPSSSGYSGPERDRASLRVVCSY